LKNRVRYSTKCLKPLKSSLRYLKSAKLVWAVFKVSSWILNRRYSLIYKSLLWRRYSKLINN
jgi:hypothetical protein